jgi:hypothetical protein
MALYFELPIYKDTYQLVILLFRITRNFSREYKYTIGQNIKQDSMEMVRYIFKRSIIPTTVSNGDTTTLVRTTTIRRTTTMCVVSVQLWKEVNDGSYQIGRSIAFIVEKPVKREIFAADFRDRIIHHWIINKLNDLFEKDFIYDSYSCREGKGTLFGVKRLYRFIRACSDNYTQDAYILQLDIRGFFMSIDRNILCEKLERFILKQYREDDREFLFRYQPLEPNNPQPYGTRQTDPGRTKAFSSISQFVSGIHAPLSNFPVTETHALPDVRPF